MHMLFSYRICTRTPEEYQLLYHDYILVRLLLQFGDNCFQQQVSDREKVTMPPKNLTIHIFKGFEMNRNKYYPKTEGSL